MGELRDLSKGDAVSRLGALSPFSSKLHITGPEMGTDKLHTHPHPPSPSCPHPGKGKSREWEPSWDL